MRWRRICAALLSFAVFSALLAALSGAQTRSYVHKKRYAMGTVFEIVVYDPFPERAAKTVDQALDEITRLDNELSNYKPGSDLSRMNRTAHFRPVKIPPELYSLIETSLVYSRLSDGEFDISVGPVVDLWKSAIDGGASPTAEQLAAAKACVGYGKIELIPPDQVIFHSDCMRLDPGSIGKGLAVDRAVEILQRGGITKAYIDAGGSTLYGLGAPPGDSAWLVRLRDPSQHLEPRTMLIGNSVSTSEQTAHSSLVGSDGSAPGHIVVPASAKPLRTSYAVSVVAKTATSSDALSTTLLLLGPEKGSALVAKLDSVAALWISPDGYKFAAGRPQTFAFNRRRDSGEGQRSASSASRKEKR